MENLIMFINGEPVVSSRQVAEKFEKQHKHVLDAIENIKETIKAENSALIKWFCKTTYKAGTGKNYPEYLMNKDGFSLLAMGFTGEKAIQWKIKYIEAFNRAEKDLAEALKHPKQKWLPPQILRCKYFNSVPCMTLADLEFVTGFDHAAALWSLKRYYIPYIMLAKETLRQYRYENNLHTCNSRLIILTQASVVTLLQKTGRYTAEIIEQLRKYFAEERQIQTVRTEVITVATDEIIGWIDDIRGHMDTLDGLLYKYQKNNPIKLQEALKETIRSIGADICEHIFRLTCTKYETKSI
ncbi:MAG: Rha family transcriptional regulator [Dialister invisus]|uniref:Rha family transcriptional regulator n=2 Tax=Dialister invisus TaxID=218538 RepID=UPI003996C229